MRVLLTNDDGMRAPGIAAMYRALVDAEGRLGGPIGGPDLELLVVAPLTVQSATSHGVTFREPLMVEPIDWPDGTRGLAVDGRPADCVKLALTTLWPEQFGADSRPDLLVSGLNAGANCGINVIYSGTVAAALEGAFLGVPSMAVSLYLGQAQPDFDLAAARARRAIDRIVPFALREPHLCLNINIPRSERGAAGADPPLRVCPMNTHALVDQYERRVSPAGDVYYWATGGGLEFHGLDEGSDVHALLAGCLTVTPLAFDLTRHEVLEQWRQRLEAGSSRPIAGRSAPVAGAGRPGAAARQASPGLGGPDARPDEPSQRD